MSSEGGEQPAPGSRWNEWEPLDKWGEESDQHGYTPVDIPEQVSESEWPTRPNSEQGEEGQDFEF